VANNHAYWAGLIKTRFFSNGNNTSRFFSFSKNAFLKKETRFCLGFLSKTQNPIMDCFYCLCNITIFRITQLRHSILMEKKCTPSLFFQSVVGQFTSK